MSNRKTVLITGNAGFIGSHIADEFIKQNFHVIGVDNLKNGSAKNINSKVDFYNVDINRIHAIDKILRKYQPYYIIHHASNLVDVSLSIRYPWRAHKDTLMTTKLIEKAIKNNVGHIIFASSANVYGVQTTMPIHEYTPTKPLSPYGLAKSAIEEYLTYISNTYGVPCCIFRYFNVYGPRQSLRHKPAIPTFIQKLMNNKTVLIRGGQQTRDFVFVKDVAYANFLASTQKANGIFNIGTGKQITIIEVLNLLEKLMNRQARVKTVPRKISDYDYSQASTDHSEKILGWKAQTPFQKGLRQSITYYLHKQ